MSENKSRYLGSVQFIRVMYGLFLVIVTYYVFTNNIMSAGTNMLIALIFDPFDQSVAFDKRPMWQRVWLIVHVSIGLGFVIYGALH